MGIIRCKRGHFYDSEKFSQCPYCGIATDEDDDKTVAIRPKELQSSSDGQEDKTIGLYAWDMGVGYIAGWLVCVSGPAKGRDYRLYQGFNKIGRDYSLDVAVMEDQSVSREACAAVVYDDKANRFYAMQQPGGTAYLNGDLLESPKIIETGAKIEVGKSAFEFVAFCREGRVWERD